MGAALPADIPFSHIGHGEKRSPMAGAKLKRMGLKPGIPDFIIFSNPLLCLEVKVGRNRLTRAQSDFADRVMRQGHSFKVIRSVDDAAMFLHMAGIPTKAKVSA